MNISERVCKECGQPYFPPFTYSNFCSSKCRRDYIKKNTNWLTLECPICHTLYQETLDGKRTCGKQSCINRERELTNIINLSVKNPSQSIKCKQKRKLTNLQKYGKENPFQVDAFKEKSKQTNILKRGVPYPSQRGVSREALEFFSSEEKVREAYLDKKKTVAELCAAYGTYPNYVTSYLRKYGIAQRVDYCTSDTGDEIASFIISLGLPIVRRDRSILISEKSDRCKEIDIFIPSLQVGIEFNGIYHHSEEFVGKYYHLNKTIQAESKGIHLIHIFSDDWIMKQEIVKERLRQVLKANTEQVFARKCDIKHISSAEAKKFLEQHHLQGYIHSTVKLGLFLQDRLVACMTFGRPRTGRKQQPVKGEWELFRFATTGVVGGASKLFKHFLIQYNPVKVISYADRHWTSTIKQNVYDKLGFVKVSNGQPTYMYVVDNMRVYRFNYRKSALSKKLVNFNPSLTEHQNMLNNNIFKIWGCGNLRYEYTNII